MTLFDDDRMAALAQQLEDELRKIGLYANHIDQMNGDGRVAIVVDANIGDIAFSDRVQAPTDHEMRSQFRGIERDLNRSSFEDEKADLERRAAEGKGFFDDDEEDEPGG